jgi:hypothetical protein
VGSPPVIILTFSGQRTRATLTEVSMICSELFEIARGDSRKKDTGKVYGCQPRKGYFLGSLNIPLMLLRDFLEKLKASSPGTGPALSAETDFDIDDN